MATEAALKDKARAMIVAMTERARWIYALPRGAGETSPSADLVRALLADAGIPRVAGVDGDAARSERVESYGDDAGRQSFILFDAPKLDAVLVEARGHEAVPTLARVLERTGFVPQSALWRDALELTRPAEARADATTAPPAAVRALRLLAHMAVSWDEDWTDVFVLHFASPDPIVRHETCTSVCVAALVCGEVGPAQELLKHARKRETFPKLGATMEEASTVLAAFAGEAIDPDLLFAHDPVADSSAKRKGQP